ncbi:hydroxyacylglutathione hydrolase [Pseudoalteromonas sp. 13-15]|jgi:hydroxyacylglutathione hydrolase|uniref:hydroxyacylglutathione hydrolase n=1 Tax=Pseudoalteromonas TaxID=53246 RepID=UPI000730C56D|nr:MULTISPECIES: hydroxyacylglutathione hydrolase [Pseudoalteromonas]AUL73186.1 hydroxyacylglutathione hydrolase [Pseudoalteromonas sp. 13-15]SIN84344.1 hydroxyacylglutathione hydrolase [Pseudoalteromonas marina]
MVQVKAIKAFSDNYIWCLTTEGNSKAWVVDPGQAEPVLAHLAAENLTLGGILITHHHYDHTDGVAQLVKDDPTIKVYGPKNSPFKGVTHPLVDSDSIDVLGINFKVLTTPGHTLDHICFVNDNMAFTGDTLFSGGCGRLFEGTSEQMWHSLNKLKTLPAGCKVFCTHEYTQANLTFAKAVEPRNPSLLAHSELVDELRKEDKISLPTTISQELKINPFMRSDIPTIIEEVPKEFISVTKNNEPWHNFAALRKFKDNF